MSHLQASRTEIKRQTARGRERGIGRGRFGGGGGRRHRCMVGKFGGARWRRESHCYKLPISPDPSDCARNKASPSAATTAAPVHAPVLNRLPLPKLGATPSALRDGSDYRLLATGVIIPAREEGWQSGWGGSRDRLLLGF